jgi:hypothetical protein
MKTLKAFIKVNIVPNYIIFYSKKLIYYIFYLLYFSSNYITNIYIKLIKL